MKRTILLFLMLLPLIPLWSQNPVWVMPPYFVDPVTGTSELLPVETDPNLNDPLYPYDYYDGIPAKIGANGIPDLDGNLKYFIIDGIIYDQEGKYVTYCGNSNFPPSYNIIGNTTYEISSKLGSEFTIVPHPSDCNKYFIFSASIKPGFPRLLGTPFHALFDAECGEILEIGPWWSEFPQSNSIFNSQSPTINGDIAVSGNTWGTERHSDHIPGFAASEIQPDGSRFIVTKMRERIFIIKILPNGNLVYWKRWVASPSAVGPWKRGELEMVQDPVTNNFKLAFADFSTITSSWVVVTHEFSPDFLSAVSSANFVVLATDAQNNESPVHGLEYSPDQSRLYFTSTPNNVTPNALHYVDFSGTNIVVNPLVLGNQNPIIHSQIEVGTDGNLYFASANGLYKLSNPNTATASDFSTVTNPTFSYPGNYGNDHNSTYGSTANSLFAYSLPDQLDQADYSAPMLQSETCCLENRTYQAETFSVSSSQTWDSNGGHPFLNVQNGELFIKDELRIEAGATLTLQDLTLHFAPGAHLVVENGQNGQAGGKLVLNNTTLTADDRCGDFYWLGVEVWGNTNESQGTLTNTTQGILEMNENSRIEHAQIGILLGKRKVVTTPPGPANCEEIIEIQPFQFDYAYSGGIVKTYEATLFNNQRGVFFLPYLASNGANNLSAFTLTEFYWDGVLNGGLYPQNQALLHRVKGIFFRGCDFRSDSPALYGQNQLGTGIFGYGSQFYVRSWCPVLTSYCETCSGEVRSEFEGLRFGVRTFSFDDLTFGVYRSDFDNCAYGVYVSNTKKESVRNCTFDIPQESYQTAGIALYNSPKFTIDENRLTGMGLPTGSLSFGIVVNNSGTEDNEIYLNDFKDLYVGGQSEGNNAMIPGTDPWAMSGLNWTCNEFEGTVNLADLTVVNGQIDYFQGHAIGHLNAQEAVLGSARNKFSQHGEALSNEHDVLVGGNITQGLEYVGLVDPYYFADSYSPNWVLPLISSFGGNPVGVTNDMCPSKCGRVRATLLALRSSLQTEMDQLENDLATQRLTPDEREAKEARLHKLSEELNLVENELVTLALNSYETLSDLEADLEDLGQEQLLSDLTELFSEDYSESTDMPDPEEPALFMTIEEEGGGRKTIPVHSQPEMSVFPNPNNGNFSVSLPDAGFPQLKVMVLDVMGRVVFEDNVDWEATLEINLEHLETGVYSLLIGNEETGFGRELIKIQR